MTEFRNLNLLAGLRGGFTRNCSLAAETAEFSVLHTLEDRWGVTPPWGACDAGVDLRVPAMTSCVGQSGRWITQHG